MEKENAPPSSRPKLSLSLKRQFAALEREEVDQYSLVKVPKRTEQSNNWAASNFEEWRRDYNGRNPGSETGLHCYIFATAPGRGPTSVFF